MRLRLLVLMLRYQLVALGQVVTEVLFESPVEGRCLCHLMMVVLSISVAVVQALALVALFSYPLLLEQ
jgi:hypothetical protein